MSLRRGRGRSAQRSSARAYFDGLGGKLEAKRNTLRRFVKGIERISNGVSDE